MDKDPDTTTKAESPVRIIRGGGDDMAMAMAWLRGTLACLASSSCGQAEVELQVRAAPALAVLMSYRRQVVLAGRLPDA